MPTDIDKKVHHRSDNKFINIPQHIQGITDKLAQTHFKLAIFAPQNLLYGSE